MSGARGRTSSAKTLGVRGGGEITNEPAIDERRGAVLGAMEGEVEVVVRKVSSWSSSSKGGAKAKEEVRVDATLLSAFGSDSCGVNVVVLPLT
jgi:hypothetical protein